MPKRFFVRMMAPIVGLSLLLLASGGFGAWYVQHVYFDAVTKVNQFVPPLMTAVQFEHVFLETQNRLLQCIYDGREEDLRAAIALARQSESFLREMKTTQLPREGSGLVEDLSRDCAVFFRRFEQTVQRLQPIATRRELREASERLLNDPATRRALAKATEYRQFSVQQLQDAVEQSRRQAERAGFQLWLLGALGATAGLLGGFGAARGLQASLVELSLPVRDAAGRLNEVVGPIRVTLSTSFTDLRTSLGELSQRVADAVNKLQETQREHLRAEQLAALGQLAAGLAHELRNPLTAMKTLVQAARQPQGGVSLNHRDLDVLEEEMTRLGRTLQTFLDYARPPRPHRRWIHPREVVQGTLDLVRPRASQQGVTIETAIPAELPPVHVDAEQMRQTLLNLFLNAFEAMPEGGRVHVSARTEAGPSPDSDSAGHWLRLEIRDNGTGLPAGMEDKLFEPFTSTKAAGTGLGLAVCRQIVESHGGSILAAPAGPRGAVFTVRLPLESPGEAAEEDGLPAR